MMNQRSAMECIIPEQVRKVWKRSIWDDVTGSSNETCTRSCEKQAATASTAVWCIHLLHMFWGN